LTETEGLSQTLANKFQEKTKTTLKNGLGVRQQIFPNDFRLDWKTHGSGSD
jgi:hypothetical protein